MASVIKGIQDVACGTPWLHGGMETVQVGLVSQEPESRGSPSRREVRDQGHEEDEARVAGFRVGSM